ncbi:MAG: ATP-grasp domain-containing protein [Cyanobacteria bacterium J06638_22]
MDLLEYQAKNLFRQVGIPVLPSQRIDRPQDIKHLTVPYPIVLKSQVYAGERAKAGGIRFVENTIDAVAAAQTLFNLQIHGQLPKALLAEAKYKPAQELYLAVVLNQTQGRPVLLGSAEGGVDVEANSQHMQQVVVDQSFSAFYARRLGVLMGLQGDLIRQVSQVVERMYRLFMQCDLDWVEINPLAVDQDGAVMALDGKVSANDDALGRQTELAKLRLSGTVESVPNLSADRLSPVAPSLSQTALPTSETITPEGMRLVELGGSIGILCNGAGLVMATVDLVRQAEGTPALAMNLGSDTLLMSLPLEKRVALGLEAVQHRGDIKVVLLNLLYGRAERRGIGGAIAPFLTRRDSLRCPVILRWSGQAKETIEFPSHPNLHVFEDLDVAIAKAVALAYPAAVHSTR